MTINSAPENLKMIAPKIQRDMVSAISIEIINTIIRDIGNSLFSILVDESRDISSKEQMAIVLRYVDKNGSVIERLVDIEHVTDTSALSLKAAIDGFFSRHGLSISKLQGQGYDGASNMRGEFNGLKALILKENESAFYVHCFAHQLQLALVAVAKNHTYIIGIFYWITYVVNVIGSSAKRHDILREKQAAKVFEALENNEISSGQGLNQETSLQRASDTRWGSHYNTILRMISMFSSIVEVLEMLIENGSNQEQKYEAKILLNSRETFDFIFGLYLMKTILGVTNELSQTLQKKDQDIVNAMNLVQTSKERLQTMRDDGWDSCLNQVSSFCVKHRIRVINMDDMFMPQGRSRRKTQEIKNMHHYRVDLFCAVIDMQLQELNSRFLETNTELLLCVACLSPMDQFYAFDKHKLIRLAHFYPRDYSPIKLLALEDQLENYIADMRSSIEFSELNGLTKLAQKMVEKKKR